MFVDSRRSRLPGETLTRSPFGVARRDYREQNVVISHRRHSLSLSTARDAMFVWLVKGDRVTLRADETWAIWHAVLIWTVFTQHHGDGE